MPAESEGDTRGQVRYINRELRGNPGGLVPAIGSAADRRRFTSLHDVAISNARGAATSLDAAGFVLVAHETRARLSTAERSKVHSDTMREYFRELEGLMRAVAGATFAVAIDHVVRTETPRTFNDGYARFIHVDYGPDTGKAPLWKTLAAARGLPEEEARRIQDAGGFAYYNVWQPFDHTASHNPLALLDTTTMDADDFVLYRYSGFDHYDTAKGDPFDGAAKTGVKLSGNYAVAPNPAHRWMYFKDVTPAEAIVFKQFDSRAGARRGKFGGPRWCPHTSFDAAVPASTPPRRSVEVRLLCFFEEPRVRPSRDSAPLWTPSQRGFSTGGSQPATGKGKL